MSLLPFSLIKPFATSLRIIEVDPTPLIASTCILVIGSL